MKNLIKNIICAAALANGLANDRILDESVADNLTIPRPRIELQWLGEAFNSAVKTLGTEKVKDENGHSLLLKKQLYVVKEEVAVNILADNEDWLAQFYLKFIASLPRGVNDVQGNWVRIRATRAESSGYAKKHLGTTALQVIPKVEQLLVLTFEWRVTKTEQFKLIEKIDIKLPRMKR